MYGCVCIASQIKLILHTPGKPCRILPSVGCSVGPSVDSLVDVSAEIVNTSNETKPYNRTKEPRSVEAVTLIRSYDPCT